MVIGFCVGICSGFSIPVTQKFGEKNESAFRRFAANGGWLALFFSIVMTAVICLMCRDILIWMDTPENILDDAYSFIFVIFLGIPATYLYNFLSGAIRSLGDSATPLLFLLVSSVLNVAHPLFGYPAVCYASPIAWIAADVFLLPASRHVMRRLHKLLGSES